MPKLKRGRGRPTAEMQQIYAMDAAQATVKELFADNYLKAMQVIVNVLNDDKALVSHRLAAAKTVKEQVETWLEEHYATLDDDEEEKATESTAKKVINI